MESSIVPGASHCSGDGWSVTIVTVVTHNCWSAGVRGVCGVWWLGELLLHVFAPGYGNIPLRRSRTGARPLPGHSQDLWVKVPALAVQWGVGR